jgi:hypothetical protein
LKHEFYNVKTCCDKLLKERKEQRKERRKEERCWEPTQTEGDMWESFFYSSVLEKEAQRDPGCNHTRQLVTARLDWRPGLGLSNPRCFPSSTTYSSTMCKVEVRKEGE